MMSSSTFQETLNQINSTLRSTTEGPYSKYSCKSVSWDDVQRGTVDGGLSCWGANITDTRLYAKDGRQLFTVRGDNWNERLGKVKSQDLALIASDSNGGGGSTSLCPYTLRSVLKDTSKFGKYAGINVESIADDVLDEEISVRFQTTFLPVGIEDKAALEFAPEAYNYNTMDDKDPRNLILLCTTQGLAIQQDGKGAKKLYHHAKVDEEIQRFWLEAESSNHKVGGSQKESKEEKEDAIKRGKATSSVIGVKAIGARFNVLMTIQVPLEQRKKNVSSDLFGGEYGCIYEDKDDDYHLSLTLKEKEDLTNAINEMTEDKLQYVIEIIKESADFDPEEEEIDLDIDIIDNVTQRKLQNFVLKKKPKQQGKPQKSPPSSPVKDEPNEVEINETSLKQSPEKNMGDFDGSDSESDTTSVPPGPMWHDFQVMESDKVTRTGKLLKMWHDSDGESESEDEAEDDEDPSWDDYDCMPYSACNNVPDSLEFAYTTPVDVYKKRSCKKRRTNGKSSAARVSRGSQVDTWNGLTVENPKRHPNEHITATIVLYYTCSGGVPTETDVKAAIDDIEQMYESIEVNGKLSEDKFNFMKSELTVEDMNDITEKVSLQPPPKPSAPQYASIFPS